MGKTTLAVHVAHALMEDFPDGHLFAVLHGTSARPADSGQVLALDPFSPQEAVELLGRVADAERIGRQLAAAHDIASACGHLPLAIRIAGARLLARPRWPLEPTCRLDDWRTCLTEALEAARRQGAPLGPRLILPVIPPVRAVGPM